MPVAGNLGNHLNVGVRKRCVAIDSTGALFDHGLPSKPVSVIFATQIVVAAAAAVAAVPGYDPTKSTATQMWLISSSATPTTWDVIPLSGTDA